VAAAFRKPALMAPPGLEQVLATFGDIYEHIGADEALDPRWREIFWQVRHCRFRSGSRGITPRI